MIVDVSPMYFTPYRDMPDYKDEISTEAAGFVTDVRVPDYLT